MGVAEHGCPPHCVHKTEGGRYVCCHCPEFDIDDGIFKPIWPTIVFVLLIMAIPFIFLFGYDQGRVADLTNKCAERCNQVGDGNGWQAITRVDGSIECTCPLRQKLIIG